MTVSSIVKCSFFFLFCPRISRVEESALRALREKLFAHSSGLLEEFKKHDNGKTGKSIK